MKTKPTELFNLIEGGRANLENTSEFIKKVDEIKKEVTDKYSLTMVNEKNWVKRILIKIKLQIEIRKRVRELSSLKNLHIVNR
jgi:hypothetical protein